jgi:hypothetical protein
LAGTFNAPQRRSTVQGFANMGGFIAAIAVMLAVGRILDLRVVGGTPTLLDYRVALSVIFIPMMVAVVGLMVFRHHTRRQLGISSSTLTMTKGNISRHL